MNKKQKAHLWSGRVGAPPGTITIPPDASPSSVNVWVYNKEKFLKIENPNLSMLSDLVKEWDVCWVSVTGLGTENTIVELGKQFGVHGLVLEDVVHVHRRAKCEEYPEHLFLVTRMPVYENRAYSEQLAILVGDKYVVTFQQEESECLNIIRDRIENDRGRVRKADAKYLAYAILDTVVDAYFPILERLGEKIEHLETILARRPEAGFMTELSKLKKERHLVCSARLMAHA